ncbi:DNA-binding IclR family transcriptional regulator [Labrys monachus]|uniref:DNA-binding IclR family transcriptional regulator n=1 Tax=Labrys monachus TaxID=217067 RepID=A0ABU0FL35_9HYPH|nr:DNA-binding IclR family transcriptional regulator [Labrys monachus]
MDLIEALAEEPAGLTQKAIADRIGRSVGEIFRMLGVLEQRGYVTRDAPSGQYRLTLRLFELAHRHPPSRLLLQAAQGEMDRLANAIEHPCHLATLHGDRFIVMAQSQPEHQLAGWSVRVGASFPLSPAYASARVVCAFQRSDRRAELVARLHANDSDGASEEEIAARLDGIAARGFEMAPSRLAQGVTDISVPIIDHFGQAIATVTIPVIVKQDDRPLDEIVALVREAARGISQAIGGGQQP